MQIVCDILEISINFIKFLIKLFNIDSQILYSCIIFDKSWKVLW